MGMKEAGVASGARRNDTEWRLRGAAAITIQSVGRGQRSRPGEAGN